MPMTESGHVPDFALGNHVHRHGTIACGQQSVTGRRGATPLHMPQDGGAHVYLTHPGQLGGEYLTNPSQPGDTTQIALRAVDGLTAARHAALSHDYDAKLGAALVPLLDLVSDDVQLIGDFGDEDDIGTPSHASGQ